MGATTAPARSNSRAALLDRRAYFGFHRQSATGLQQQADAQPLAAFRRPASNWLHAMSWNGRLMLSRASGRDSTCMNQRSVGHAARHRPGGPAHVGRVDIGMRPRLGLSVKMPHQPAGSRSEPPMSVPMCKRAVARRRRGAGAGAGAARRAAQVPGVARQLVEARQAGRQHAVVGHGGLGDHHAAGFAHARRRWRVRERRRQLGRGGAQRRRVALGGDVFLDGDGHAVQRAQRRAAQPARLAGARLLQRDFGPQQVERLEMLLPALDVAEHGLRDLHRREIAPAVACDQFGG